MKDLLLEDLTAIDDKLSQRHIDLDPHGYFIIYIDKNERLIYAKHFTNIINERGLAVDPETGKVYDVTPEVASAMTRDYSALMAAINAKKGK